MKKIIPFTLLMIIGLCINAQINLEHTFQGVGASPINTQTRTIYYTVIDYTIQNIYNDDYTFYKTISITPPYGYKVHLGYLHISDKLFNLDNNIEFIVSFQDTLNNTGYLLKLYNENGTELMDFGNAFSGYPHQTINNQLRFNVLRYTNYPYDYSTDIYSLPGTLTSIQPQIIDDINPFVYPNPAKDFIFINYKINASDIKDLKIYDSNGVLIETKRIGGAFDKIKLDISEYKSGLYIYRYNDLSDKFIVK